MTLNKLKLPHWMVVLPKIEGNQANTIGMELCITSAHMYAIANKFKELGLILCERDGRKINNTLTEKGKRWADACNVIIKEMEEKKNGGKMF